jgi:ATP-dependent RNA helicase DeaD
MAVDSSTPGFSGLVDARIERALQEIGWSAPTPMQVRVIPHLVAGRDLVAQAPPDPSTTAAFGIPMLQRLDPRSKAVQGLVLVPVRDQARKVAADLMRLGAHTRLRIAAVYEGEPIQREVARLREKPHIVVGTPRRVLEHLVRGTLTLRSVHMLVLDDADRMLTMGQRSGVEQILVRTPSTRQTALFSAALPEAIRAMVGRYLRNPIRVAAPSAASPSLGTAEPAYPAGSSRPRGGNGAAGRPLASGADLVRSSRRH